MTEALGIRQDVTNSAHHSTRQFRSGYLPSTSNPGTLSYKRRILDRWTERIYRRAPPGNCQSVET